MYYLETFKDDGFHKFVASMTGAALKGQDPDEGVYKFEDEKACDRAVGVINKTYGSGIFTVVVKGTIADSEEEDFSEASVTGEKNDAAAQKPAHIDAVSQTTQPAKAKSAKIKKERAVEELTADEISRRVEAQYQADESGLD